MTKKNTVEIIKILKEYYPDAKCSLDFNSAFELAIAVMLSAQCTDERVNKTTKILFSKYKTPNDFINIEISELEQIIRPCGFYKVKAKNIKSLATIIQKKFGGQIPNNMQDLIALPGIGRKSANVIMLDAFNNPEGIAVDTHVKRISKRIGFTKETDPEKIEKDLLKLVPKGYIEAVNHLFIWHGRSICKSQNPNCSICPISNLCKFHKSI